MLSLLLALAALPSDSVVVHRGDLGQLEVSPPFAETVEVRIDGRMDEPAWRDAVVLTGFTQYDPAEGTPASQRTEVRVFYTAEAMYFGIQAYDTEPELVRATLSERDRSVFADDWVRIMLDTFNDNRQAYVFYINPLGIQQDGLWLEGGEKLGGSSGVPIDFNPDFIWDSHGQRTPTGWAAEVRIPYVSLRFPQGGVQTWGVNFAREIKRSGFKDAWAPLTQNQASTLAQSGRFVGLRGIEPKRLVEVRPVATAKQTAARSAAGEWTREGLQPEVGLNARLGVTPNLVLDATLNPDFSQLEADEGQIVVNERFRLFLPEKRPFFLEGTEIFQTPQRLVYTRSIVDPVGGAKLTGKLGSFNVGYLGALDAAPAASPGGEHAMFNLFRLRRDVGTGSTIGALLTDRTLSGSGAYNRVLGLDSRLLFAERYALTSQVAGSWTRAPLDERAELAPLLFLQLARSGRDLNWQVRLTDIAPTFHARSGFLQRTGEAQLFMSAQYNFFGRPGALLERWGPELRVDNYFTHAGFWRGGRGHTEGEVELQWNMLFRGKNRLTTLVRYGQFNFQADDYAAYQTEASPGTLTPFATPEPLRHMLALAVMPHLQPTPWLTLGGRVFFRELPIYTEANRGFEVMAGPNLQVWPAPGVSVDLSHTYSRLWRTRDQSLFSTASISRAKLKYQFTRALSARVVAQHSLQDREPLRDPVTGAPLWVAGRRDDGRKKGDFGFDVLAAYEPSPGKVVYLGWARQMVGPDTYRYDRMEPQAEGLFLKLSYLYRI